MGQGRPTTHLFLSNSLSCRLHSLELKTHQNLNEDDTALSLHLQLYLITLFTSLLVKLNKLQQDFVSLITGLTHLHRRYSVLTVLLVKTVLC